MTDRADDLDRLDDARHVLGEGSEVVRQTVYVVYVVVLLALTYGLTVARAAFLTSDPRWLRDQLLSWPALLVVVAATVLGASLAYRTGRARGPVVPPLPFVDVVVPSAIDRALTLRRWWRLALVGGITGGVVLGGIIGGGLWFARVGGPLWLVGFVVAAVVIGLVLVVSWLQGQASLAPSPRGLRRLDSAGSLRRLRIDDLRQQAARSTRLGGAMLAGDLRAVRLEVASPVTRGRSLRLRSTRPVLVIARRDRLGLRRMPGGLFTGAALTVAGTAALGWAMTHPEVPAAVSVLAVIPCYLGFGAWAEGLRLQGDNAGTPPLIGLDSRQEATGHLVVPVVLFVVVGAVAGSAAALGSGGSGREGLSAATWSVPLAVVLAGAHLIAAFRGMAPRGLFGATSPQALAGWYLIPLMLATLVGGTTSAIEAHHPGAATVPALTGGALLVMIGFARVRALGNAHRV